MSARWLHALCAAFSLWLGACADSELRERTQVVVAIYADSELARRLSRIEVEVRDEAGLTVTSQHEFELAPIEPKFPLSFGVYQAPGGADWFMLVARAFDDHDAVQVEYKVIAQFVAGTTGLLSVALSNNCLGLICSPSESCYREVGRCVPVERVTPDAQSADGGVPGLVELDGGIISIDGGPAAPPSTNAPPVPPSSHGIVSVGGRRGDGTITLSDDGFELGARTCTLDGLYCVTGSLVP